MPTPDEMKAKIEALKKSGYRIDTAIHPGRVVVTWNGEVIAETHRAVVLNETRHAPVFYIPRTDTRMTVMERTLHTTRCPFKGDTNYFSLVSGQNRADNAVWSYETPVPDCAAIAGHLAFYTKDMGANFGIEVKC